MVDEATARPAWKNVVEDAITTYRGASPEEKEVVCWSIGEEYGDEAKAKLRELFGLGPKRPKPRAVEEPKAKAAGKQAWVSEMRRRIEGPRPKPEAKPVVELRVIEQAKAEPEPEEPQERVKGKSEAEWNGTLDREAPLDNARKMIGFKYWHKAATVSKLRFWQDEFWEWKGKHWKVVDKNTMRSKVYEFLDVADQAIRGNYRLRFLPTDTDVNKTVDALKAEANLTPDYQMPGWLLGEAPVVNVKELVAVQNGLLHVGTRKLIEHTPRFWSPNVLEFEYDPRARAPRFQRFLEEIFPGDKQAQDGLLEMIGLCVTDETRYQKAFMFIGPRRGGRGTIGRLLRGLVGEENYVGANLRKMVAQFGMQSWIGKKVAIFPDVRTDGMRLDRLSTLSEILLSVTGEDAFDIERKWLGAWSGRLTTKVIMFSNELIKFQDDSGALPGRFITWRMEQSFWGKEDLSLTDRLLAERSGILNLALDALDRLRARGYLVQPASGAEMSESLELLASGIMSFVGERCEIGAEHQVLLGRAYAEWRGWCGVKGIRYAWGENHFSEKLKAVVPTIRTSRPRKDNSPGRPTMLIGIGLRKMKFRPIDAMVAEWRRF